jgi:hypothetical protein
MRWCNTVLLFFLTLGLSYEVAHPMSKQQEIDTDITHWVPFEFFVGDHSLTLKVPPGFRAIRSQPNSLPKTEYDGRSEMYLLQKQYDYQSGVSFELAQLVIWARLTRLAEPLPLTGLDKHQLIRALNALRQRPMPLDRSPPAGIEVISGREWSHLDFGNEESFCTLVDANTLFTVSASYGEEIKNNAAWLADRKNLVLRVRDTVVIHP